MEHQEVAYSANAGIILLYVKVRVCRGADAANSVVHNSELSSESGTGRRKGATVSLPG
jgi:hypothetical protein